MRGELFGHGFKRTEKPHGQANGYRFAGVDDDELIALRASSFGARAQTYARHRPDYPADAVRWALAAAGRPVREVLDLGAGTGKLTGGLLALGHHVTAVEPDPGMRAELTRAFPEVNPLPGTAERIPLPDAAVDAVLAGQALHWFDLDAALPEIARVLRPGGVVGGLWNFDDERIGWVAELNEVSRSRASRGVASRGWSPESGPPSHPAFDPFEQAVFPHSQRYTAESLTAAIGTHSHTAVIPAVERAELLERVRAFLKSRPETAHGQFDLPIRTTVIRAQVR